LAKQIRLITFRVGPETFAADIMAVRQIVSYEGSTAVPAAPRFVEGIIVVRNEVVPVIDLGRRFFPDRDDNSEQPLVMVVAAKSGTIGLKVDEVRTIVTVTIDELLPAPSVVRGVAGDYLVGVAQQRDELLLLLDLEAILTGDEQRTLQSSDLSAGASER